jgi:hypothetical protein
VTRRVCAHALVLISASIVSDMTNERVVLTRLSIGGWSEQGNDPVCRRWRQNRLDRTS